MLDLATGALAALVLLLLAREIAVTVKPLTPVAHVGRHRKEDQS